MFSIRTGCGFITREDRGGEVFVQHSGIQRKKLKALAAGHTVGFETMTEAKGLTAIHVIPQDDS